MKSNSKFWLQVNLKSLVNPTSKAEIIYQKAVGKKSSWQEEWLSEESTLWGHTAIMPDLLQLMKGWQTINPWLEMVESSL